MPTTQAVALGALVVWVLSAVALGLVMQRRGYSAFGWGVIGGVLGPVGILVALTMRKAPLRDHWEKAGLPAPGSVDVLVGTDGSAASIHAAQAAIELLERRLGRVTIASVVPYDATTEQTQHADHALDTTSDAVAARLFDLSGAPGSLILHGPPADALRDFAAEEGYDVIVVGSHGHGASSALLGSVAGALVARSSVPLLVGGRELGGSRTASSAGSATAGAG